MYGALKRGRFRSLASLILVVNVVDELQRKRTLAASRGFLAAARLSCSVMVKFYKMYVNVKHGIRVQYLGVSNVYMAWASPTPSQNVVGSTNGMDRYASKVVWSGPKIRTENRRLCCVRPSSLHCWASTKAPIINSLETKTLRKLLC